MSERYSDVLAQIKAAVDESHAAHEMYRMASDKRLDKLAKENEELRDRIEEMEAKASSPGKTSAPNTKQREHTRIFCKALRGKFENPSTTMELANIQAELGFKDVTIGTTTAGGFALPEEIAREIGRLELQYSPVRRLVKVTRCGTNDYKELVDETGATSGWVGETGTRSATATPKLRERAPTMGEIYSYPVASEWSLDDLFFDVSAWLADSVAREFAKQEGIAVISGNGTTKPTGMLNTAPVATADFASPPRSANAYQFIASDLTPGGTALLPDALIDLCYAVNSAYRVRGTWAMNSLTAAIVRKLKDTTNQYLWQAGLAAGQPDRLLGYPVEIWENMPNFGVNAFCVAFGDFQRGYVLVDRTEIRILRDPYTTPGFVKFYVRRREGGHVLDNHAIKFLQVQ